MDCIFCKIVNGEIPSYTLYEDEIVKVFLDVNPKHNGHTLIVPKKHFLDIDDIDMDTLTHIMKVAKKIKKNLDETLSPDGIMLLQNNGDLQEVKHFHMHLIPNYKEEKLLSAEEMYNILKEK